MRFVSGREALMLPEVFEADVHSAGKCRRIQVKVNLFSAEQTDLTMDLSLSQGSLCSSRVSSIRSHELAFSS